MASTYSAKDLGFVQLEPHWPLLLKLGDVVNLHQGRLASGQGKPVPAIPVEILSKMQTTPDAPPDGTWDTAAVDVKPEAHLVDGTSTTLSREAKLTLSHICSSRAHVVALLQRCSKELVASQWADNDVPLLQRYLAILQYMSEHDARDVAYFYWHPAVTALDDTNYEAGMILATMGICELRVASAVVRIAASQQGEGRVQSAYETAEETRRLAYKLLCSAAFRFESAVTLIAMAEARLGADTRLHPQHASTYFSALHYLSLAQAQEIGFHRAQHFEAHPDSTSLSKSQATDGLRAGLAHQAAILYRKAVEAIRRIPRPQGEIAKSTTTQLAAAAVVLDGLDKQCSIRHLLYLGMAHVLQSRPQLAIEPKVAVAHCCQALTLLDKARAIERNTSVTGQTKIAAHEEMLLNANACITAFVEQVAVAVQKMNELVAHANPTSSEISAVEPPPAKELARPKPYSVG